MRDPKTGNVPNESKLQRALMPNSRMFLLFLIVFAVLTFFFSDRLWLSIGEGVIILLLIIYSVIMRARKRRTLERYIESVTYDTESARNNTLQNFPLPMAVFRPADSQVIWANQNFFDLCGRHKPSVDMRITDVIPEFSGRWLLEGNTQCPELLEYQGRKYQIHGNLVRTNPDDAASYMGITYWVDVTDYEKIRLEYYASRPIIAVIVIDNYDELIRGLTDRKRNELRDAIEDKLLQWCEGKGGFFRRYDRDRYLYVFEERHLDELRENKFASLLDIVHSVTSPSGEGNMRGPQDAFTEHLRNNISQLRRQFRTGSFTAEICTANTRAKTEYAICYDTALAPADVVQTLKQRLAGVQIPVLLDSTYFASFLKQDKLNLFPAAAYTERPATACARICEGKIVILVSGSPLAMVVPSFFAEHFECLDDYSSGAVFAGLIRLLKYLAFLLAVFGPGLYVMAVSFAPELIPVHLLAKLAQGEASTPLPPMPEMLAVTLLLEIVREAGLRAPKSISHTVSLVGALIIGETAVSAGIISVPVLTMAAAATIATLAVPALYEQSILFRFAVILLAGTFGVPGLACGALLILAMACGSDPFGYDYLYPLMPPGKAALRDGFVRAIWSRLAQKGEVLPRHAKE